MFQILVTVFSANYRNIMLEVEKYTGEQQKD